MTLIFLSLLIENSTIFLDRTRESESLEVEDLIDVEDRGSSNLTG